VKVGIQGPRRLTNWDVERGAASTQDAVEAKTQKTTGSVVAVVVGLVAAGDDLTVTADGVASRADSGLALGWVSNGRKGEGEDSEDGLGNHFDGVVWFWDSKIERATRIKMEKSAGRRV
jgi:hypothetical protein